MARGVRRLMIRRFREPHVGTASSYVEEVPVASKAYGPSIRGQPAQLSPARRSGPNRASSDDGRKGYPRVGTEYCKAREAAIDRRQAAADRSQGCRLREA